MNAVIDSLLLHTKRPNELFFNDVVTGLSAPSKSLPSKYFYDELGSALFDKICELDEYYPTRVETGIMQQWADEMARHIGPNTRLVEYGSGSSVKTRFLLDHLVDPAQYLPIDISGRHLLRSAASLAQEYPLLDVLPVAADFSKPFDLPETGFGLDHTCIYFPGSTIGNFEPADASALLCEAAARCQAGDGMLIGFDLQKDVAVIEAAYNDRAGVTAAFNKNVLHRINTELDGDFDVDGFEHHAFYNHAAERIEMHLVSQRDQVATVGDSAFNFGRGETIRTEYSHKYSIDGFSKLAGQVGWHCRKVWTDSRAYFSVMYLER